MVARSQSAEYRKFLRFPFQHGIPTPLGDRTAKIESGFCAQCGSVLLFNRSSRGLRTGQSNVFCDGDCANEFKQWQYLSDAFREKHGRKRADSAATIQIESKRIDIGICRCCKKEFHKHDAKQQYCSDTYCRRIATLAKRGRYAVRRKYGVPSAGEVNLYAIARSKRWICDECGCKCNSKCERDIADPTLDHIVPLSKGGWHIPSNVRLLCRHCNSRKGATVGACQQLMLPISQ